MWYSVLELELWYSFLNFAHTKHGKAPKATIASKLSFRNNNTIWMSAVLASTGRRRAHK